MKRNDYYELINKVDEAHAWTYQESEGSSSTRFDDGEISIWINYSDGHGASAEGHCSQKVKNLLDENGIDLEFVNVI